MTNRLSVRNGMNDRKVVCQASSGRFASRACCRGRRTDGAKPGMPNMQMAAGRVAATFEKAARVRKAVSCRGLLLSTASCSLDSVGRFTIPSKYCALQLPVSGYNLGCRGKPSGYRLHRRISH
jgi:hypothetical protein